MKRNMEKQGNRIFVLMYAAGLFVWGVGKGTLSSVSVLDHVFLSKEE